jgi:putative tricarboxylic transport membrane protein
LERRCSKHPEEFGKGAIEGVAGPESANNAATSGAMVPMLALGIPFSPPTALLLAALIIQGVQPGPLLIQNNPEVFWGVIASMYIGNVALLILNIPLIGMWVSFLRTPQPILLAAIFTFVLIGTYSVNNSIVDLIVLMVMGCIGYILRKLNFDVAPMILAIVLGPFMERSFRQSLYMSNGDLLVFLERPISAILLFLVIAFLFAPIVWRLTFRRRLESPEFSKK